MFDNNATFHEFLVRLADDGTHLVETRRDDSPGSFQTDGEFIHGELDGEFDGELDGGVLYPAFFAAAVSSSPCAHAPAWPN